MAKSTAKPAVKTRIQNQNEEIILDAALEVFAAAGFRGATVDQIAARCGMSKPNLLYYFRRKEDIYHAVLERTLDAWLEPLRTLDPTGDPHSELARYISAKLDMAFTNPVASRLFANEVLHGAPVIQAFLATTLKQLVEEKAQVLRQWVAVGKMADIDPYHLIFAIWAVTQHYADFATQVTALIGKVYDRDHARRQVMRILLDGVLIKRS